jgi:hypothetical protein
MENSITILLDRCFECETIGPVDLHHVVPKSKGGTKMIPLCLSCHTKVHGEHMLKFRTLGQESRKKIIKEREETGIPYNLGRREGSKETIEKFMNKTKNIKITELLNENKFTIREIVKITNSSLGTVMKVKKILEGKLTI